MKLRLKYLPLFREVLSGKATSLFFQMDWRLGLIMDLQLTSQTPLIELVLYAADKPDFSVISGPMHMGPIAFEHYRIHVIELWPDGPRKRGARFSPVCSQSYGPGHARRVLIRLRDLRQPAADRE